MITSELRFIMERKNITVAELSSAIFLKILQAKIIKYLNIIRQIIALQNMKTAEATWSEYFDHPPEVASRQHMTAKIAWNDNATYRPIKNGL